MRRFRLLSGLLLLGAFLLTSPVRGQDVAAKPGVRAGVALATIYGDDAPEDADPRIGFMAGGLLRLDLGGVFTFQPEFVYAQKGWTQTVNTGGTEVDVTSKLDYIEVPALLKARLPLGIVSPNLFAGPTAGVNIRAQSVAEGPGGRATSDLTDEVSTIELGVTFGGGLDVDLGASVLMIDARAEVGLTDISSSESDLSIKNTGFMVTAGFVF